jgi:hypothetical protein
VACNFEGSTQLLGIKRVSVAKYGEATTWNTPGDGSITSTYRDERFVKKRVYC